MEAYLPESQGPSPIDILQTRVAELERRLADEERGHGQTIDERDRYHDWADKLAQAIAEHMRDDIGERRTGQ